MRLAISRLSPDVSPTMRILGIDPGLRVTGFGVLDKLAETDLLTSGCIRTQPGRPTGAHQDHP